MKLCPKCEINYILNLDDELCEVCREEMLQTDAGTKDSNKARVEEVLLPFLRSLPEAALKKLTEKELSLQFLQLRLPLLKECRNLGEEACKQEIILDKSKTYRYYIKPYRIGNKYYHICSQWWSCPGNRSKDILGILKELTEKKQG